MLIYVTCRATAAETGLPLGFSHVPDAVGALLISQKNAYGMDYPRAFPAIGYCDPDAVAPGPTGPTDPPPPPPPPPPPEPMQQTITIGPEDTVTRIDVDGDGHADVLIVVDRPPQNP